MNCNKFLSVLLFKKELKLHKGSFLIEVYSNETKLEGIPMEVTMGDCEHSPVLVL